MASQWSPQDDFLLRKSIENGASLESLAKGAVKFSRIFTLSELTDRWQSLLYEPSVTSMSSSIAFEDQYSSQLLPQTHQTTRVRSHYYSARKRMRLEEILNEEDDNNAVAIDEDLNHIAAAAFGDIAFDGSEFLFDESDIDNFHNAFPDILPNQMLNINDGQIQDCTDTTTAEHFLLQEEFEAPLFQQSFNEATSSSQPHHNDHGKTWFAPEPCSYQDLPTMETLDQEKTWFAPESSSSYQDLPTDHHNDHVKRWFAPESSSYQDLPTMETLDQGNTLFAPETCSYQDMPTKPEEHCYVPMSLSELDPHPEIKNGVIICTLNQASYEIPDNKDFKPHLFKPNPQSCPRKMKPPLPPIRVKEESGFKNSCVATAFKDNYTENATTSTSLEDEIYAQTLSADMGINFSMSEAEENNNEIESDEDLPSYSDVEAMILDMDLEPVGQDRYEMEATRYQNEETARMVMRLEQSSKSYMNRNMDSHGAFALLYGSSRHYIKKPEVLLGRATGEYPVDIDLGRSGSETKVSRRQALIKLKQDGSFEIKNLGKFSIWMNDKEIEHGQVVGLMNNCLIQIRNISFIFEMNEKAVQGYLNGVQK